ncbi:MAG: PAS domain S-box protein [Syntrophomonadaceae bacterium]
MTDLRIRELEAEVERLRQVNARLEQENRDLRIINEEYAKAWLDNETALSISRFKDDVILYMNDYCLKILGYQRDEVIGKSAWDINVWVDIGEREVVMNEFSKRGYARNIECRFRKKKGGYIVTLISTSVISVDGEKFMVLAAKDISATQSV